jgi:metal-responsive CopG/Arc/MetJ family transcriptional regulator
MALARTNVTLPEDLLRQVDELAGPRGRSAYVAEAVLQKVKRDRLHKVLRETRGAMKGKAGQRSQEEIDAWLRELRRADRDAWGRHE